MDADRFDALSRVLITPGSRRATLRALLGTLLGGALLEPAPDARAAASKKPKAKRRKGTGRGGNDRGRDRHGRPPRDRQAGQDPTKQQGRQHRSETKTDTRQGSEKPQGTQQEPETQQRRQQEREPTADDAAAVEPVPEAAAPARGEVTGEEVSAATHGCGHTGTACGADGQCCSGRCSAVQGTCCLGSGGRCKRGAQCCSGLCKGPKGKKTCRCAADGDCAGGKLCRNGRCVCDTSVGCGDACPCPGGTACRSTGQCGDPCAADEQDCDGVCRNLQTDDANCGVCGTRCDPGQICRDGACRCTAASCPNGCCAGNDCTTPSRSACGINGTACVACNPDRADACVGGECRCGTGPVCPAGRVCQDGTCRCPDGLRSCDGTCKECCDDTHCPTERRFCVSGACRECRSATVGSGGAEGCGLVQTCCAGVCCRDFESCSNGQCVPPDINICFIADTDCADGRRCCKNLFGQGLACRDLSSDRFNCGACNRFCIEPGRSCCNGVCCADAACCGGTCRDLAGDPRHCGACGTACQGKQDCVDGGCVCQAPNIVCGGECVDPRRDKRHCNGCNQTCGTLEGCCDSVCRNLTNDPDHCGGCDRGCNGQPCQEGECVGCGGPGAFCGAERPPCCSGQCNVEPGNNFGECG